MGNKEGPGGAEIKVEQGESLLPSSANSGSLLALIGQPAHCTPTRSGDRKHLGWNLKSTRTRSNRRRDVGRE